MIPPIRAAVALLCPTRTPTWTKTFTLAIVTSGLLVIAASAAHADVFVVNLTTDLPDADVPLVNEDNNCDVDPFTFGDQCTLRAAIQEANATDGTEPDTINFNIPGCSPGSCTILLTSDLPALTDSGTTINGFSQNNSTNNSTFIQPAPRPGLNVTGSPCPMKLSFPGPDVAIDGAGVVADAMTIGQDASNILITGLAVYGALAHAIVGEAGDGIGDGTNRTLDQVFIGVLPDGSDPGANRNMGFGGRQLSPGQLTVRRSYVGFNGEGGLDAESSDTVVTFEKNEVFNNGWNSMDHDGIDVNGINSVARCNLSHDNTNSTNPMFLFGMGTPTGSSGTGIEVGSKQSNDPAQNTRPDLDNNE